jgi:SAM-dependent methyltransferase
MRPLGLRTAFDEDAELYDRARPRYPEALFEELLRLTGLDRGARVLEVGCGTGQATLPLARRGLRVTCVELGENMARVARRNLRGQPWAEVHVGTFESWPLPAEPFDLVLAATCWDWIEPAVRFVRAASALRPGGALAIVGTAHVSDERGDALFTRAQDVYERCVPEITHRTDGQGPWRLPAPSEVQPPEIDPGLFREPVVRGFPWVGTYTAAEYLDLLSTFSEHRRLAPARRDCLFDGIAGLIGGAGGVIRKHHLFTLAVATRR